MALIKATLCGAPVQRPFMDLRRQYRTNYRGRVALVAPLNHPDPKLRSTVYAVGTLFITFPLDVGDYAWRIIEIVHVDPPLPTDSAVPFLDDLDIPDRYVPDRARQEREMQKRELW